MAIMAYAIIKRIKTPKILKIVFIGYIVFMLNFHDRILLYCLASKINYLKRNFTFLMTGFIMTHHFVTSAGRGIIFEPLSCRIIPIYYIYNN
ncbi:hypothetical protein ASE55_11600 [Chryseobacterium sp. Leaf201]|nr:hypothetical protein ASE55_11600 [Chryseobacterium sp. Leaf201]